MKSKKHIIKVKSEAIHCVYTLLKNRLMIKVKAYLINYHIEKKS